MHVAWQLIPQGWNNCYDGRWKFVPVEQLRDLIERSENIDGRDVNASMAL